MAKRRSGTAESIYRDIEDLLTGKGRFLDYQGNARAIAILAVGICAKPKHRKYMVDAMRIQDCLEQKSLDEARAELATIHEA